MTAKDEKKKAADEKKKAADEKKKAADEKKKAKAEKKKAKGETKDNDILKMREQIKKQDEVSSRDTDVQGLKHIREVIQEEVKKPTGVRDTVDTGEGIGEDVIEEDSILTKLYNLIFGKEVDKVEESGKKSYVPIDRGAKELVSVTKQELTELRKSEEELKETIKHDKLNYMTRYAYVQNALAHKLKELDYVEKNTTQKLETKASSISYLKDKLDMSAKSKLDIIREKERILETKRQRDKEELDDLRNTYIAKLNKAFNYEYRRMKKSYDSKHRKQKRILLDLVNDYTGANESIIELRRILKQQVEIPVMVKERRTKRKGRHKKIRTHKKIKHPEDGVYALKDYLLSH